jgi:hypothetical protein
MTSRNPGAVDEERIENTSPCAKAETKLEFSPAPRVDSHRESLGVQGSMTILLRLGTALTLFVLAGCGLVAAPCRIGSAVLDIIPVVGHTAATPTDACASAIDPP